MIVSMLSAYSNIYLSSIGVIFKFKQIARTTTQGQQELTKINPQLQVQIRALNMREF